MKSTSFALALFLALPTAQVLAANNDAASPKSRPASSSVSDEIKSEMAAARKEVRTEIAQARKELETENLNVGDSLKIGGDRKGKSTDTASLPKAEITPQGDFLIDGKAVTIDANQRRELLAYRGLVIDIANSGIDIGERAALAAINEVDRGLFSLMVSALSGNLERRVERMVKETVQPAVEQICRRLPDVMDSQQRLATGLPAFAPYANLKKEDVTDCESSVRESFASR